MLCLQNFKTLFFSLYGLILVTAMCRTAPENILSPLLHPGRATEIPRGWGGEFQKEAISEGVGACYRGLFPGVLSEIGELSINYSSVEKAISYFTVTGVSKRVL